MWHNCRLCCSYFLFNNNATSRQLSNHCMRTPHVNQLHCFTLHIVFRQLDLCQLRICQVSLTISLELQDKSQEIQILVQTYSHVKILFSYNWIAISWKWLPTICTFDTAFSTQQTIIHLNWQVLSHPAYFSDLTSSKYYLFCR
jgi:hypothetical protein